MIPLFLIWNGLALALLRAIIGVVFVVHGWPKLKDLRQNTRNFSGMGFRPGGLWGTLVALLEFFGGLALLAGFFTQVFALLFAIEMIIATAWRIKNKHRFSGGYELDLLLLVASIVLMTAGGGIYALDNFLQFLIY